MCLRCFENFRTYELNTGCFLCSPVGSPISLWTHFLPAKIILPTNAAATSCVCFSISCQGRVKLNIRWGQLKTYMPAPRPSPHTLNRSLCVLSLLHCPTQAPSSPPPPPRFLWTITTRLCVATLFLALDLQSHPALCCSSKMHPEHRNLSGKPFSAYRLASKKQFNATNQTAPS